MASAHPPHTVDQLLAVVGDAACRAVDCGVTAVAATVAPTHALVVAIIAAIVRAVVRPVVVGRSIVVVRPALRPTRTATGVGAATHSGGIHHPHMAEAVPRAAARPTMVATRATADTPIAVHCALAVAT